VTSKSGEKSTTIFSYGLIVMCVTHALTHLGVFHTAIFSILRDEFNLSLQQLGIIAAIPPLCQALLYIPSGLFSDRYGSKKMLIINFTVAVFGTLLASQTSSPIMLIVAISLIVVNTTIYHPASYSFTAKMFKLKDRSKGFGLHGAIGTLGHALGPLLVSILIGLLAFEWRQVYLILVASMLLSILMVFCLKDKPSDTTVKSEAMPSGKPSDTRSIFNRSLMMFLVYVAFRAMAGRMIGSFLVLYLQDVKGLSITLASLISSGTMLTGLLAAPIGGYLASKYGDIKWLLNCRILGIVFLCIALISPFMILFVILYLTSGFMSTLGMAARSSLIGRLSPSRQHGLGYALFFLPGSIMGVVAPLIAGFLAEVYGFNTMFYIAIGIYVIAVAILKFTVKID
jgi:MFS family permease